MKKISVLVPQSAVIEAITLLYRLFKTANQFLAAAGKPPMFEVTFVSTKDEVLANDGEYSVKIHHHLNEVKSTDLVIIPALYGDMRRQFRQTLSLYHGL